MAKITDPDSLTFELSTVAAGTANIVVDTAASQIEINTGGSLTDDGVTLQAVYSKLKEIWKTEPLAIPYDFPMEAITPEQFEFIKGWKLAGTTADETLSNSEQLIRDAGFLYRESDGTTIDAEFIGFDSVFALNNNAQSSGDQIYVEWDEPNGATQNMYITGQANQPLKVFKNAIHNYKSNDLRFFCREQGKDFAFSSTSALNVPLPLTYKKYAFPLSNSLDSKINGVSGLQDADIFSGTYQAPFDGMSITSFAAGTTRNIGGVSYTFDIIIDGNNATAEQIYAFVQYELRLTTDIDDGVATLDGNTADEMLTFVGDDLYCLRDRNGRGIYIDNFNTNDTNRIHFADNATTATNPGTGNDDITFPFVAAGNIQPNSNLQADADAFWWMYFENDDAGSNTGRDFFTDSAIIVRGNTGVNKAGSGGADFTFVDSSPDTVTTTTLDLSVFSDGQTIEISGSTSNDGFYLVSGAPTANSMTLTNLAGADAGLTAEAGLAATEINVANMGPINGSSSIGWDFDYDNNLQRGTGSDNTPAPIVVVAIGLSSGQYVRTNVIAEGSSQTITRAVGQNIALASALERNYSNP